MQWVYLTVALACEVAGTLSLRAAAKGRARWYAAVALGYLGAFGFLSLALHEGVGLGVAYGIWSAVGVAVIALLSKALFGEPLTLLMSGGIALILGGVLLIQIGAA